VKRAGAALALAAARAAASAAAKPAQDALVGRWAFKTAAYGPGCVLEGEMTIAAGKAPAGMTCTFEARETCRSWAARAKETCTITRTGKAGVEIASQVTWSEGVSYKADDFSLTVVAPDEMRGVMNSVHSAPVVFSRKVALTS
jgi:hypothetical protein